MDAGRKPLARTEELIVEELGDELLVYDEQTDRAHCLSPTAARVWRRCDGRTPVEGLRAQLDLDAPTVDNALDELVVCGLLEAGASDDGGTTRRELTVRLAKAGGAVAAAPLIVSIVAPTPSAAQTPVPGCEGIFLCTGNCGVGTDCRAQTGGCICCQYSGLTCEDDGAMRPNNIKLCAPGTTCPPDVASAQYPNRPCATACNERQAQELEGRKSTQSPSTQTTPDAAQAPTPETPATPAPEAPAPAPDAAPTPAPEPTPAPVPEPAPAPAPAPDPTSATTPTP